jgi:hypothetical protein
MKTLTNKRIKTGLLSAALAGGTILGATQVGGIVNAQVDDATTDTVTTQTADPAGTPDGDCSFEDRREQRQERREDREADAQEVADLLGVTTDDLRDWARGGGTLAEIAEQNGVSVDAVVELIVQQQNERLDAAVADGKIDADRADELRAEIEARVTTRVNEGRPDRGDRFGHRGDRGRGGPDGGPDGSPDGAPPADDAEG